MHCSQCYGFANIHLPSDIHSIENFKKINNYDAEYSFSIRQMNESNLKMGGHPSLSPPAADL